MFNKLKSVLSSTLDAVGAVLPIDSMIDVAVPVLRKSAMTAEKLAKRCDDKADELLKVKAERKVQQTRIKLEEAEAAIKDAQANAVSSMAAAAPRIDVRTQKLLLVQFLGWMAKAAFVLVCAVGIFFAAKCLLLPCLLWSAVALISLLNLQFGALLWAALYAFLFNCAFSICIGLIVGLWRVVFEPARYAF